MATPPSRTHIGVYLFAVGGLAIFVIGLLYATFTAGLTDGVELFLADPSGAVQENPLGLVALAGIFFSVFVLMAVIVLVGSQYVEAETGEAESDSNND